MLELRLYLLQRISAAILAPMLVLHLGGMLYARQGGLSAEEILARTRGSLWWGAYYGFFVLVVAGHAAIGMRNVLSEWAGLRGLALNGLSWILGLGLWALGWRAVVAVVGTA